MTTIERDESTFVNKKMVRQIKQEKKERKYNLNSIEERKNKKKLQRIMEFEVSVTRK